MNTASTAFLSTALVLASLPPAQSAQVDLARNSVKADASPIKAGDSLASGRSIVTGSKAKTQISLGSNGSLARAGSRTEAVLQNETDLSLRQGVMLASSGKRTFGREAVSVETPETKSTVKGTMLVAYQPKVYIKVTCIEGQVTIKLKAMLGEFVTLQAGQMVIINPAEKRLPNEVEVDLDELTRTCALLGSDFPALWSAPRLARAVDRQVKGINQGDAIRTPLILTGAGLEVSLDLEQSAEARRGLPTTETAPEPTPRRPRPSSSPPSPPPYVPPEPETGPEYIIDETTTFSPSKPSLQTPDFPEIQGLAGTRTPTTWPFPDSDPFRGPELLIRGTVHLPSTSFSGDAYIADGWLAVGDDGTTEVSLDGPVTLGASQAVTINSSNIVTSSDRSSGLILASDRSVEINHSVIDQSSHINVVAPSITIGGSKLTAGNNGIRLSASGAGTGISIRNSSQLLSMATSAGIALLTEGSPIAISDSTIDGRDVLIDAAGSSGTNPGTVDIRNSVINGDLIRARAFNTDDRNALVINGSTFNASSMIKFYAEGSSKLLFRGSNTLDLSASDGAGRAILAGHTVEVENGGAVNVRGNLEVYRDVDNYNKSGFGRIDATGQQSHQPFSSRPGF